MESNKRLGTEFEREMCGKLRADGWWVHFIAPDIRGAQPFDIIAARYGVAIAADCKTSVTHIFRMARIEDNQQFAFGRWMQCGNIQPMLFVKYRNSVRLVPYNTLKEAGKVDLRECAEYSDAALREWWAK